MTSTSLHIIGSFIGTIIGCIGITVIFVGCLRGLWLFVKRISDSTILLADIRIDLGHYLVLGIEFLVGKDIIETLAEPTWDHLGKLAALIALRTILTLLLAHEVKDIREEMEEEGMIRKMKKAMIQRK